MKLRAFALVSLAFGILAMGCASSSGDVGSSAEPAADEESEIRGVPGFVDEGTKKQVTVQGFRATVLQGGKALRKGPLTRMQDSAGGGIAFFSFAARVSAADANALARDPAKLAKFADEMLGENATRSTADSIDPIGRADVVKTLMDDVWAPTDPWPEKGAFEADARIATQSLLSKPTIAVFGAQYCPDWRDNAIIAVTTTGEIRVLHLFGDQ